MLGDVNSDGTVDLTDLSRVAIYLLDKEGIEGDGLKAADVDGDSKIQLADLARIKQFVSKQISKFWFYNIKDKFVMGKERKYYYGSFISQRE